LMKVGTNLELPSNDAACTNRDIYVGMSSEFECADGIVDTAHTEYAHL
nr:hypothetical protein [Tanacetum cinerariifolium]